jgi:hypothetical protein
MQGHFKTKLVFTFGVYYFVWRHAVAKGLRDDFGVEINPGKQVWASFIPVYGAIVNWRFLKALKATIDTVVVLPVGSQRFSPARAFWWSSIWFAAGPYVNRHINTLYAFQGGRNAQ